ncbi:MAG: rRNA maturation RNase YbeY [Candidatus Cloacimonetes bacterium]|nr:rRNA maturation RNase YbeY [Candidatus Cloacimonadota bacterium]
MNSLTELVLREEKIDKALYLSLLITTNDNIREINRKYRGVDAPTDVLSFTGDKSVSVLGDIVISIDHARLQKFTKTVDDELCYLFLHGLLHLLGYDHISEADSVVMTNKQTRYWNLIKNR